MTPATTLLLAHQGGWDEALIVLAPLLLFAGLLLVARRRVEQMETDPDGDDGDGDDDAGHPGAGPGEEHAGER